MKYPVTILQKKADLFCGPKAEQKYYLENVR